MDLQEIVTWLANNSYLVMHKGRYLLTSKFYQEMTGQDIGVQIIDKPKVKQVPTPEPNWVLLYQKLILESKMPRMSDNGKQQYQINVATKPGREAFKKAIKEGYTYEQLLRAVKEYYGEAKPFLVKIEKFFVDELWRSDNLKQSSGIITADSLFRG